MLLLFVTFTPPPLLPLLLSCQVASDFCDPTRLLCPRGFPSKNTGVGCHFPFRGIFPTQGWNEGPSWQPDPLPLSRLGSPSTPPRRKQKQAKSKAGSWNTGGGGGHELVSQKTAHFRHMNVFKVLIIAYTPRVPLKRERPIHTAAEGEDLDDLGLWSQGCRPFPSPQPRLPLGNC